MNCEICHRAHHPQRLPFYCAVDARNRLYESRLAHAQSLIENDALEQSINAVIADQTSPTQLSAQSTTIRAQNLRSEEKKAVDRTNDIIAQADKLRSEMEKARDDIQKRKQAITRRKSDLAAASSGISARRTRQLEETEKAIQMTKYKWNRKYDEMAAVRGFLCKEAAQLYGLRRSKKGNSAKYEIGGLDMVDVLSLSSVVLLAYDIAWACCSQGVAIGDKTSYEDVCNMGRNLYNLLISNPLVTNPAGRTFPRSASSTAGTSAEGDLAEIGKATTLMGKFSHGAAHTFLGSAEGNEFVRSFKLPNPIKLADRLKKKLISDAPIPDWELLEDDAWAVNDDGLEDGVLVKGRKQGESDRRAYGIESVMTVRTALDAPTSQRDPADNETGVEKTRVSSGNGWTKLKTR
ncbi:hypothetical protein UCRPA7_3650 [Phaeoacremonium minimum UCRPA7]|uniref:Autophagy-related protein 14 n=1 Tax=Phaeoacremonium minimum (strain UCR-PA7) TaxID=1286976 RepID=R8BNG2_PHAM7|nr:hypothetical protein UCRPA7_3650 [Phaeoacremonium minimum UCRPA7]EOO00876.1 hypothetical protein UCRPA7_3650 [Phaeoacremonium minimum UCRPA7]